MLAPKSDFVGLEGITHLASGGQPPLLCTHQSAFDAFAADKAAGMAGYERHWQVGHEVKSRLAILTGLESGDFALLGNASEGIARVVSGIDWQGGDNAVVPSLDYASGRYALARLGHLGVDLRLVAPQGWFLDWQEIIASCNERTRLVYVSHVNAHTGQRLELEPLSEALRERGIALLVDASHSLGAVPLNADLCDFLVCSTYKFLLSPHSGILAWNRKRWPSFEPLAVGWHAAARGPSPDTYELASDASRAEIGNSNHLTVYLLKASLDYLAGFPAAAVEAHVLDLGHRLRTGLEQLGLDVLTPAERDRRGPNVAFAHEYPRRIADLAAQDNILLWGEAGRVRASMHLFVEAADVDRFLEWLPGGLAQSNG